MRKVRRPGRTQAAASPPEEKVDMSTVTNDVAAQQRVSREHETTGKALAAGGTFATAVAGVILAAGNAGVDNLTTRWAIVAVCVIAALTMFTTAILARR